jgi:hypothetical protein
MEPTQIIALALTLINQASKAAILASNDREDEAEAALRQARSDFDAALDRWDNAPGPDNEAP